MATLLQRMNVASKALVGIFSEQSLSQVYRLLSGVLPGGMGVPPVRGSADYLRAYSQMPWLRAVSSRVSTATASAEWQLFVVKGKKEPKARRDIAMQRAEKSVRRKLMKEAEEKGELVKIEEHPLLEVLHNANEFQTGFAMRKVTQLHLDLVGDAFWLKERDAQGTIVAVWPIPPHWIMATPTPAFRFFRVSFRAWRGNIPDTEFVWFSDVDPLNPYGRGSGSAMALGDELDTDEYAARHTKAFFYNQARPDLLIWPKGPVALRDSNIKRLEEDWMSQNQGFFRAFKPYFLTREVDVKELDQNLRAMQFVQLREFERNVVLQHFGVPPEILGVLESSNRATIDAADYFMSRYVVEPRLEFQRQVLQERLAPEYDERLIVEYVSPIQEDKDRHLEAMKAAPFAPTVDEWRKAQGLGPLEDEEAGKLHMVSFGVQPQPIEYDPAPPPEPVPDAPPSPAPEAPKPPAEPTETEPGTGRRGISFRPLGGWTRDFEASAVAADEDGDADLAKALRRLFAKGVVPAPSQVAAKHEPTLIRALVRVWADHATRVSLAKLTEALGPSGTLGDVMNALDVAGLGAAQTASVKPILVRSTLTGVEIGGRSLRANGIAVRGLLDDVAVEKRDPRLTVTLSHVNPAVTEWANAHAAALVQAPADVRAQIAEMVARANEEGIPPEALAKMIRSAVGLTEKQSKAVEAFRARLVDEGVSESKIDARVDRYATAQRKARALTIARTETIASVNAGQQMLWGRAVSDGILSDAEFEKIWLVTEDDLLDVQICEPLTDARTSIDGDFDGGIKHPPAHPNCRCAVGLVPREK